MSSTALVTAKLSKRLKEIGWGPRNDSPERGAYIAINSMLALVKLA